MKTKINKIDITKVKVGMIWYEDNTFSFNILSDKKRKAIVELIEDEFIYGYIIDYKPDNIDTVELFLRMRTSSLRDFVYSCEENEKLVYYNAYQQKKARNNYADVKKTFERLKDKSKKYCLSITTASNLYMQRLYFIEEIQCCHEGNLCQYNRPVLTLKAS